MEATSMAHGDSTEKKGKLLKRKKKAFFGGRRGRNRWTTHAIFYPTVAEKSLWRKDSFIHAFAMHHFFGKEHVLLFLLKFRPPPLRLLPHFTLSTDFPPPRSPVGHFLSRINKWEKRKLRWNLFLSPLLLLLRCHRNQASDKEISPSSFLFFAEDCLTPGQKEE